MNYTLAIALLIASVLISAQGKIYCFQILLKKMYMKFKNFLKSKFGYIFFFLINFPAAVSSQKPRDWSRKECENYAEEKMKNMKYCGKVICAKDFSVEFER